MDTKSFVAPTARFPALLVGIFLLVSFSSQALAERIAIIGTGNVGSALGTEFAALGHEVVYGSRDPSRDAVKSLVERTAGNASATTPSSVCHAKSPAMRK